VVANDKDALVKVNYPLWCFRPILCLEENQGVLAVLAPRKLTGRTWNATGKEVGDPNEITGLIEVLRRGLEFSVRSKKWGYSPIKKCFLVIAGRPSRGIGLHFADKSTSQVVPGTLTSTFRIADNRSIWSSDQL
jgi:hypothetical protein